MTDGEVLAVGWLQYAGSPGSNFCTATLISPRVVATAAHCFGDIQYASDVAFGVGLYPSSPRATFGVSSVSLHPSVDAALVILSEDATARVPELRPIHVRDSSPSSLVGGYVEVSGYGQTDDGSTGRHFAAVVLESVGSSFVRVDGRGEEGLCFGDSGGPLLGPGPVIMAVESEGDSSCVGQDTMTRLDVLSAWIEDAGGVTGGATDPTPPADGCDGIDYLGRCSGAVAEWCEDGTVKQRDCAADGRICAWVDGETGYWCVDDTGPPQDDGCGGLDYLGRCDGTVAVWCEDGALAQHDCAADGEVCAWVDGEAGYWCVEDASAPTDACGGLDFLGRCDGTVSEWCEDGELRRFDCVTRGEPCGWVDDQLGYTCVDQGGGLGDDDELTCALAGATGTCDGGVAVWCPNGALQRDDCSERGQACQYVAALGRYGCVEASAPVVCSPADDGCDGDLALRCIDGGLARENCAIQGLVCVVGAGGVPSCEAPAADPAVEPQSDSTSDPATPGDGDEPAGGEGGEGGGFQLDQPTSVPPPAPASADADGGSSGGGCATGGEPASPLAFLLLLAPFLLWRRPRSTSPGLGRLRRAMRPRRRRCSASA